MSGLASSSPSYIELAGLPGCGKTTICNLLVKRLGVKRLRLANGYITSRYKALIGLAILPVTVGRFHRFVTASVRSQGPGGLGRTRLSVLSTLNGLMMEYGLAAIEAAFRRKLMILDGGFVQHGISVWLRAADALRTELWSAYLEHVPDTTLCIVLDCDPVVALQRARARPEGVPAVFKRHASSDDGWLLEQYRRVDELLGGRALASRVNCVHLDAGMECDEIVNLVVAEIQALTSLDDVVVR